MSALTKGDLVRHPSLGFLLRVTAANHGAIECMAAYGPSESLYLFSARDLTKAPRPFQAPQSR